MSNIIGQPFYIYGSSITHLNLHMTHHKSHMITHSPSKCPNTCHMSHIIGQPFYIYGSSITHLNLPMTHHKSHMITHHKSHMITHHPSKCPITWHMSHTIGLPIYIYWCPITLHSSELFFATFKHLYLSRLLIVIACFCCKSNVTMYTAFNLPPPTFIYPSDCSADSFQQFMISMRVYCTNFLYWTNLPILPSNKLSIKLSRPMPVKKPITHR